MLRTNRDRFAALLIIGVLACGTNALGQRRPLSSVTAGHSFSFSPDGTGDAVFYLLGPDQAVKRNIRLGSEVTIEGSEVETAGVYQIIICTADTCSSTQVQVTAGPPARLSFFLHPSRVPVATPASIDATIFVFDRYYNSAASPAKVTFDISPASGNRYSRDALSARGIAWLRLGSTEREGPVRVTGVLGELREPRVIQQVSGEACGLRIKAVPDGKYVSVETDPVRDCRGNPLPDGTVVSFTSVDDAGKTTVDTPLRKGIARTRLSVKGRAQISVACGVVLGNELSISGSM